MNEKQIKKVVENISSNFRRSIDEAYIHRVCSPKSSDPETVKEIYYTEIANACRELIKDSKTILM